MNRIEVIGTVVMAIAMSACLYVFSVRSDRMLNAEIEEARNSRAWAAAQVCGQNASYKWVSDTELQCLTKHNRKTGPVVFAINTQE